MKLIVWLLSSIFAFASAGDETLKLSLVQILWRHGDRAPSHLYPRDPNSASFWREGLGKLTQLGRRQHYALGKYFRRRYANFVTSDPNEVLVNSTDYDRCLRSAEVNIAAFYEPTDEYKFLPNVNYQPIPIYFTPKNLNKYLATESTCSRAAFEEERLVKSPRGRSYHAKHSVMYDFYSRQSGYIVDDWVTAWTFYDTLMIEKKYNQTIPPWVNTYWDELEQVANEAIFEIFNSPVMYRLRAGPFIGLLLENMFNKLDGKTPNLKVQIYSAHDDSIAVVLAAMKMFDKKLPPYCASFITELYESSKGKGLVRFLYQNSTNVETRIDPPHVLVFPGCAEFCPLEYIFYHTRHLVPNDWNMECGNKR